MNKKSGKSKKYEIMYNDPFNRHGAEVYRIRALRDIPKHRVKAGDIGGFISSEANLSQEGDCWVGDDALVIDDAQVDGDALVCDYAEVVDCSRGRGRWRGE